VKAPSFAAGNFLADGLPQQKKGSAAPLRLRVATRQHVIGLETDTEAQEAIKAMPFERSLVAAALVIRSMDPRRITVTPTNGSSMLSRRACCRTASEQLVSRR
jgi:hypothetical protein